MVVNWIQIRYGQFLDHLGYQANQVIQELLASQVLWDLQVLWVRKEKRVTEVNVV
jgi:hypothetical protein